MNESDEFLPLRPIKNAFELKNKIDELAVRENIFSLWTDTSIKNANPAVWAHFDFLFTKRVNIFVQNTLRNLYWIIFAEYSAFWSS